MELNKAPASAGVDGGRGTPLPPLPQVHPGQCLRRQAWQVCRLVNCAWRDPQGWLRHVEHLVMAVDEFKLLLQLGKEVRAFAGFGQFQQLAKLAVGLGKQSAGWRRRLAARPEAPSR